MQQVDKLYKALKKNFIQFTGGHGIHTPKGLVDETLGKVPLNKDILVLFNIEFVISLIYTFNVDPEQITFYSDHKNKDLFCEKMNVKYIHTLDIDMKFDVIVGNPPYQEERKNTTTTATLYDKFFYKGEQLVKYDGIISMIIPSDWVGPGGNSFKNYIFNLKGVKEIQFHPYQKYFKVKKATCNIILDKTYCGDCCKIIDDFGNIEVLKLSNLKFLHHDLSTLAYRKTFDKFKPMSWRWLHGSLNRNQIIDDPNGIELIEGCGRQYGDMDIRYISKGLEMTGYMKHKIVMPMVGGTAGNLGNNVKIAKKCQVGGHGVVFLITNSDIESANLISYLNTTPIKKLIKCVKQSSPNSKSIFEEIPDVDLSVKWSDQLVYKHFNFTAEMIEYAIK